MSTLSYGSPALRRIHIICETAFDALFVVDSERCFRGANVPTIELLGASLETILAARIDDFTPPDFLAEMEGMWADLNRNGTLSGSYPVLRGDGRRSLVEFRAHTGYQDGEHLIAARPATLPTTGRPTKASRAASQLTARQLEVLQLAADGRSVHEIADGLFVSVGTIRTHFGHIHAKLGVNSRAAAVASALRQGLIS